MELSPVMILLFIIVLANRLTELVFKPIRDWLIDRETSPAWLDGLPALVSALIGFPLIYFAGLNILPTLGEFGRVLTSLIPGAGASILHDFWQLPLDKTILIHSLSSEEYNIVDRGAQNCCPSDEACLPVSGMMTVFPRETDLPKG